MPTPSSVTARTRAPLLVLALGLFAVACSDAGDEGKVGSGIPNETGPVLLRSDTRGEEARAGIAFTVDCRTFRDDGGVAGTEVALPWPTTLTWVEGPAPPVAIDGHEITLSALGEHRVACRAVGADVVDTQGSLLPVVAGPPKLVQTRLLDPDGAEADAQLGGADVKAGTEIRVRCEGQDAFGHPIAAGWSVSSTPELEVLPGASQAEFRVVPTKATGYDISCRVEGTVDSTPARLQVVANVPKHLYTLLEPSEIEAGNAAKLACVAQDAYGNPIADFPFSVDHSEKLALKGLFLSATEAGLHSVRCVPESLSWDLFTLHAGSLQVVPAAPAELLVARIPDKGVYKRKEKVKFAPTVRDAYGNVRPDDSVVYAVDTPATGFKDKGEFTIQFNVDNTYEVRFTVAAAPAIEKVVKILVDGAPPLLVIDYPGWGSMLDGKPSVVVEGKAGDEGAGIKSLKVNGKNSFPDALNEWKVGLPAAHGLTQVIAEAIDIGEETSRAVRGFYYSGKYYPTDAGSPKAHMVDKAIQVFLGKDFFDDGDHNPSKPNDMATIIEVVAGAALQGSLLPSNLNQGDISVTLSNTKIGPLKANLTPYDGGLGTKFEVGPISTDLKVKAKIKLGPIKTSVSVSGDIKIDAVRLATNLKMHVVNGYAQTEATQTDVQIDGMKLHVDGIAGLFDFLWNMLLKTYQKEIEKQIIGILEGELPKMLQQVFDALAINQSIEIPPSIPGGKTVTISLVSFVKNMVFTTLGATIELDASFVSQKGVPYTVKGSIGRDGCVGTSKDEFVIDTKQRIQLAMHDDLINQMLYALWYGGALQIKAPLADLTGESNFSGFSLDGATLDLDFLLPPILEACNMPDPMKMRLQVGDLFATIQLMLGSDPLDLHNVILADAGLTLALGKDDKGETALMVTLDKELGLLVHLQDITKSWADQKATFQNLITKMLTKALTDGALPLGEPIVLPLPATTIDLSTAVPGLPPGVAMTLALDQLARAGGYTSIVLQLQ